MNRFRTIAVTAIAGFVLVACGPAATESGSPSSAGQASQAPSEAAQASEGGAGPSFSEGIVAELEALIPDTVGTLTVQKQSMRGSEFLVSGTPDPSTVKFLQDLGVSPSDVSIALGFGFDAENSFIMFVIRAAGADSARLLSVYQQASAADTTSPPEWVSATVGGEQVQTAVMGGQTAYLYAKGDILFFISSTDPDTVGDVISKLG